MQGRRREDSHYFPLLIFFSSIYIYIYIQVERSHLSEHYIDGVSLLEAFIVVTITNVGRILVEEWSKKGVERILEFILLIQKDS